MPNPRPSCITKRAAKPITSLAIDGEMHVAGGALVDEFATLREGAEPALGVRDVVDGCGELVLLEE